VGVAITRLEPAQAANATLEALALHSSAFDLRSTEAIAAIIRRAASFLCPTTPGALVRNVGDALLGLPDFDRDIVDLTGVVESLLSYGDLIELPSVDDARLRRIFLGPPAFVLLGSNRVLLVGIRPDGAALVGDEIHAAVEYRGVARLISRDDTARLVEDLILDGLMDLRVEQWLQAPREMAPSELVRSYQDRLQSAPSAGSIDGVQIIDSNARVTYYKGRWRALARTDDGLYAARRPRAFGADLWCFGQVVRGEITNLMDLPVENVLSPGSDEAWRLQAALDAVAGHPQVFRVREQQRDFGIIDFFSPVPSWIRRRLEVAGQSTTPGPGALFAYAIGEDGLADETGYVQRMMWLSADPRPDGGRP
jgi:hypothetical protein